MSEEKESWRRDESEEKGNTRRDVKSMRFLRSVCQMVTRRGSKHHAAVRRE